MTASVHAHTSVQHVGREEFKLAPQVRFILAKVLPAKPKASDERRAHTAHTATFKELTVCVFTAQKLSDGRPGPQLRVAAVQAEGQGGKRRDSDSLLETAMWQHAVRKGVMPCPRKLALVCFAELGMSDLYLLGTRGARASPLCAGASFFVLWEMIVRLAAVVARTVRTCPHATTQTDCSSEHTLLAACSTLRVNPFLGEPLATSSSQACADTEGGLCVLLCAGGVATPPDIGSSTTGCQYDPMAYLQTFGAGRSKSHCEHRRPIGSMCCTGREDPRACEVLTSFLGIFHDLSFV